MQHKLVILAEKIPNILQWSWIVFTGLFANTFDYAGDIYRMGMTVLSMGMGTVVAHFIKKFLNRKK
tara:strand:+ start:7871 stop:8068 length:198 start_codon:yes stop_codon:yes gene_type:complete